MPDAHDMAASEPPTNTTPINEQGLHYRPDIDGLRAIAVLVVVFYHLGFSSLPGGYVGVDVFFVISGFLITRLVMADLQAGTFSFSEFYERRARRLFPTLYVVVALSFLLAMMIFSPKHLTSFGGAAASTLLGVSNVFFWRESGYFDVDGTLAPLLHLWSLCVEEQFYLVWPAALVTLCHFRSTWVRIGIITATGVASLVLSERLLSIDAAASFYLMPFRVVEFAIGALMVWLVAYPPKRLLWLEPLALIGLALIAYPVVTYTSATPFPGLRALAPCMGTALLIYAGSANYTGALLRNRLMVGLGLISYSLYMSHWPIIVFYRYYKFDDLSDWDTFTILLISLAFAFCLYRFVEQPFWRRRGVAHTRDVSPARFTISCVGLAILLIGPSLGAFLSGGWPSRLPKEIRSAVSNLGEKAQETGKLMPEGARDFGTTLGLIKVLIVGDSHSIDLFNAVYLNQEALRPWDFRRIDLQPFCFYLFTPGASPPPDESREVSEMCHRNFDGFKGSDLLAQADYVLVSGAWSEWALGFVPEMKAYLDGRQIKLALLGRTPVFTPDIPSEVFKLGRLYGIDRQIARNRRLEVDDTNRLVAAMAADIGAAYGDKLHLVCDIPAGTCTALDSNNNLTYHDADHWTLEGAKLFGHEMVETHFFANIMPINQASQ
jgi:peptidoglycan/LPS O-acetylase OafA/YrhL